MKPFSVRSERRFGRFLAAAAAAALFAAAPALAAADDDAAKISRGKYIYSDKSNCVHCHGWAGDGRGHPRSPGNAPSLRTTFLDEEQLMEVIACGRPGTEMPYHDRHAYSDGRCFGLVAEDLGEAMPKLGDRPIREDEIEAVVAYLKAKVLGRGEPTFEDCEEYFGVGAGRCQRYQ